MSDDKKKNEGQLVLKNVRLGYPKLFHAEAIKGLEDSKPRYGCALYLPKSDVASKARIDKEIARITKEHLKGVRPKSKDISISDGDGEDGDENTAGCWIINANRAEHQGRPQVVDRNLQPLTADDEKPYAGCYVMAVVCLYKPKAWNKVACSLEVIQFSRDGERFGAAPVDVHSVLTNLEDEDEDGDGSGSYEPERSARVNGNSHDDFDV